MAIPIPSTSPASAQSGLTKPFMLIEETFINFQASAKIEKLESGGNWFVMFYSTTEGTATTDGHAYPVANEAAADAVLEKISLILGQQGALTIYEDLP